MCSCVSSFCFNLVGLCMFVFLFLFMYFVGLCMFMCAFRCMSCWYVYVNVLYVAHRPAGLLRIKLSIYLSISSSVFCWFGYVHLSLPSVCVLLVCLHVSLPLYVWLACVCSCVSSFCMFCGLCMFMRLFRLYVSCWYVCFHVSLPSVCVLLVCFHVSLPSVCVLLVCIHVSLPSVCVLLVCIHVSLPSVCVLLVCFHVSLPLYVYC